MAEQKVQLPTARGATIGVLGCGIDDPKGNKTIFEQFEQLGGVIGEFPIGKQGAKITG